MKNNIIKSFETLKFINLKLVYGFICAAILCTGCSQSTIQKPLNIKTIKPQMVTIPSGTFQMGSNDGDSDEKPAHQVTINAFKMSQTEVTFAQWDACVSGGGCAYRPDDEGWGRGNRPVINMSYDYIIQQFIPWLNQVTGNHYRLPSEAEWEYAARAGSTTKYAWGNVASHEYANYGGYGARVKGRWVKGKDRWVNTSPVKSFSANQFGLYDMQGNVWEWVQDCWNDSYQGAPSNGTAWISGDCSNRLLRGGGWNHHPHFQRSANRSWFLTSFRHNDSGFRLAQDLRD